MKNIPICFRQSAPGHLPYAPHLKPQTSVNSHFMASVRFCMTDNIAHQVTNWFEHIFQTFFLQDYYIPDFSSCTSNSAPADPKSDAPCCNNLHISNLSKFNRSVVDESSIALSEVVSRWGLKTFDLIIQPKCRMKENSITSGGWVVF